MLDLDHGELVAVIVLAIAALLTSALSAIIGMGGGIMLLAVMFCFLPHSEAIPSHAAVQLTSNGTRILVFLKNVDWRTWARFVVGMAPGMVLGAFLLWKLGEVDDHGNTEPILKLVVGAYILIATFLPKPKKVSGTGAWWDFPALGLVVGTAALTIGAIGPLIAPLFARRDFVKERLIATKAVCQMTTHLGKIPAFLLIREGLEVQELGLLTIVMIVMVIPGTLIGKKIQKKVSSEQFVLLYKVALTLAGLKVLLWDGVAQLLMSP